MFVHYSQKIRENPKVHGRNAGPHRIQLLLTPGKAAQSSLNCTDIFGLGWLSFED